MKNNGEEEIELAYREKIEELRNQYQHELSSHAFVSLYLWRKQMKLTLHLEDEMFAVKCGWKGENAWFFPCGHQEAVLNFFKKHKDEENFSICYARNEDIQFMKTHFPNEFFFFLDEASHEYIYEKEGHRTLVGKKYANLRTQLHKIEREHSLRTEPLNSKTLLDAKEIVRNWSGKNHWEGNFEAGNGEVEEEALNRLEELGIFGIVVYMDEKPYAVAAGYPLSEHTYDLFLAKERERISGLSYYAKREFFLSLPQQYQYINMEEDLGIEGLRKMKKILNPIYQNEIWEAVRCQK